MDQAQDKFAVVGNSTGMDTCGVTAGAGLSDMRGSCPNRLAWRLHGEAYSVPTGTRISITNCQCFNPRHSEQTLCVSLHEILFLLDQSREESPSLARIVCIAAALVDIHLRSLFSWNAKAGGWAGRSLCKGLPRWWRACSLCLSRRTEFQSLTISILFFTLGISVWKELSRKKIF